jgi:hypothetical protein
MQADNKLPYSGRISKNPNLKYRKLFKEILFYIIGTILLLLSSQKWIFLQIVQQTLDLSVTFFCPPILSSYFYYPIVYDV